MTPEQAEKLWLKHACNKGVDAKWVWMNKEGFLAALAEAGSEQWISVEERLPEEGQENRVLMYLGNLKYPYTPHVIWGYYECGKWQTQWGEYTKDYSPTHWQPLPQPPKVTK